MFDDMKGCGRMLPWAYQGDVAEGLRKYMKLLSQGNLKIFRERIKTSRML
jgi:hypothetical protein